MSNIANTSVDYGNQQKGKFDPRMIQSAVVMDNRDPTRSGRLKVWIQGSQSEMGDKTSWITCKYSTVFAGSTKGLPNATGFNEFPSAYGFWAVPPDVGATVMVAFINGNIYDAVWFGCLIEQRMNAMIPSMSMSEDPYSGHDMNLPKAGYDRTVNGNSAKNAYMNSPLIKGLTKQNLLYDKELGLVDRSATRQTTSTVYGLNSPRGHAIIIDDGYTDDELTAKSWDDDPDGYQNTNVNNMASDTRVGGRKHEGVILRTRSGAQIYMSEESGSIHVINRDGTARITLTEEGEVNIYADGSVNVKSEQDINFVAKNFNIDVSESYNVKVGTEHKLEVGENMTAKVGVDLSSEVGSNVSSVVHGNKTEVIEGSNSQQITGDNDINVNGNITTQGASDISVKSGAATFIDSGADMNIKSGANAMLTAGSAANINGGSSAVVTGGGDTLAVGGGSASSSASMSAPDFKTQQMSLNSHIHAHETWVKPDDHSNESTIGYGGGESSGKPQEASKAEAGKEPKAVEVQAIPAIPTTQTEEVVSINAPVEIQKAQARDISTEPSERDRVEGESLDGSPQEKVRSLEGYQFVMPCDGIIGKSWFWGRDIEDEQGKTYDSNGWLIMCNSDVVAPYAGKVKISSQGSMFIYTIYHQNGYKSVIYGLNSSEVIQNQFVDKGQKIGTSNEMIGFEIRMSTAGDTGFSGTVDPGLFYYTKTGVGSTAGNKQLIKGETSSTLKLPSVGDTNFGSQEDTPFVNTTPVVGIGSGMAKRGSKHAPQVKKFERPKGDISKYGGNKVVPPEVPVYGKEPSSTWKIDPYDSKLLSDLKHFEGDLEGQKACKTYRNGKFHVYLDSVGERTIGYGHLMLPGESYPNGITEEEADALFIKDVVKHVNATKRWYNANGFNLPYGAQMVLAQMVYQMGVGRVSKFKNTLKYMNDHDYKRAANGLRNSLWYRQTVVRAEYLAQMLEACG